MDQPFFNVLLEVWNCGNSLTAGVKAAHFHQDRLCYKHSRFLRVLENSILGIYTISLILLTLESNQFFD